MRQELKERLEKIQWEARKTFGPEYSKKWLRSPSRYFDGKAPLEYARKEENIARVLEHIGFYKSGSVA